MAVMILPANPLGDVGDDVMMMMNSINLIEPNSVYNGYVSASAVRSMNSVSQHRKPHKQSNTKEIGQRFASTAENETIQLLSASNTHIPRLPVPVIPSIVPLPCLSALAPSAAPFSISDGSLLFLLYYP